MTVMVEQTAPESTNTLTSHEALEVRSYDGGWLICVVCSCSPDLFPTTSIWISEHFQGSEDEGVAALKALVRRQREGGE